MRSFGQSAHFHSMHMFFKICLKPLRLLPACIVTLILSAGAGLAQAADNISTLRLMVVPQFPSTEINATWGKLVEGLKGQGLPRIELVFPKDINDFESQFLAGQADLIYCNPYHIVMARKAQGYVPLVRDSKPMSGILIAANGSDTDSIQSLNDLNGKTLLFPSPNAFGASLYMRALLTREKGLKFTTRYVKTHPNVLRGVVRNEGQAGGMVNATLAAEPADLQARVRVIYETPKTPSHPIAAHPRVSPAMQEAITKAIIRFINSNQPVGEDIQLPDPVRANYARDYQPLEKLGLEAFVSN
ncbi:MAG TPA: phosphate/phosphite/phosphonate ABC transporter substrate-binding protein [Limnobacter sp.]|nr:phosphate/phosphite/phosphonate ABC transporter substrate-binding protein [Limnobacter sp.]